MKTSLRKHVPAGVALVVCGLGMVAGGAAARADEAPRQRVLLDADWRFQKDDPADATGKLTYATIKDWVLPSGNAFTKGAAATRPAGNLGDDVAYTQAGFDDSGWRKLNLPHDWGIEGGFNQDYPGNTGKLPYWGVGWYRKHFTVDSADSGKRFTLCIDGAMSYATVWLNGQFVGGWPYGYSSFQLDLTPYIKPGGENVLAIRLDNPNNSSRWYPGGGIYRNVWLTKTGPVHVGQWGTYVTTPTVSSEAATVDVRTTVVNDSAASADAMVTTKLYTVDAHGGRVPVASGAAQTATVAAGQSAPDEAKIAVKNPKLWDLGSPNRYVAVTEISQGGQVVDRYETVFGIRTIRFTADNGFLLNGKRVPINGVCDHHDLGALGAAFHLRAAERQLEILKEMGCNALRTSHNPPAPELLDLCDRMGILVMDESFDCWQAGKTRNDYHLLFADWHEKDLRAEYRRDRNHPSIILWSLGNEVRELGRPEGVTIGKELTSIAHDEDPTRPTSVGCNYGTAGFNGFQNSVDVFGYNYQPSVYPRFHAANPTIPLYGSETSSAVSSRGEYFFPVTDNKNEGKADFQVSSYDLYAPSWATTPDTEFKALDAAPYAAGEFVWTGFDYLGEPTPYNNDVTNILNFSNPADQAKMAKELQDLGKIQVPSRSSYFGIVDLCGFRKDRYYLYQAHWRPDLPMAHILPHWNWPDRVGQVTPVHVYTSGDEAELFLNGKSMGRKKKGQYEYRIRWDDVVYQPGTLKVVAYKNGRKWAEDTVKTTGSAAKLQLAADRTNLTADGTDLCYVTVTIEDKNGLMVPRSKNSVRFSVSGPAEIVGVDNGDATDHTSFQAKEIKAFNGLCLVILRTQAGQAGPIVLHATSDGLQGADVTVRSKAVQ